MFQAEAAAPEALAGPAEVQEADRDDSESGSSDSSSSSHTSDEESVHDDPQAAQDLLALVLDQDDPRRMRLTENEWNWALDIKDAIEADAELDNLNDFMYAQYAIVCKGDPAAVLERATVHQHFRQAYSVRDTYEDGCTRMQQMFDLAPGQFLDFNFSESHGSYIFINDPTKLDSTQFTTSAKINGFMGGTHYFHTVFNPDLDSVRKGIIVLAEAEHWSWTKKQDFKIIQKQFDEFIGVYPFIGQCRFYNSGVVFNMMAAILRRVLPTQQLRNQFKTGYTSDIPLNEYYLLPDMRTANERMLTKMKAALKRRYENEKSFSLLGSSLYRRNRLQQQQQQQGDND